MTAPISELDRRSTTVFVVDDDQVLLDSIVALLESLDFPVCAFTSAADFRQFYRAKMPGCLILDIRMPRQNGLQLYEQLLCEGKRLPVIFVSGQADVSIAVAAMKMGAVELLEKPFDHKVLIDLVHKALNLDAQWRARDALIAAIEERVARLSGREFETLQLIQAGGSNKSMAAKLRLTERAIEMRRSAIMRKLQVTTLAELFDLTITHRILSGVCPAATQRGAEML